MQGLLGLEERRGRECFFSNRVGEEILMKKAPKLGHLLRKGAKTIAQGVMPSGTIKRGTKRRRKNRTGNRI